MSNDYVFSRLGSWTGSDISLVSSSSPSPTTSSSSSSSKLFTIHHTIIRQIPGDKFYQQIRQIPGDKFYQQIRQISGDKFYQQIRQFDQMSRKQEFKTRILLRRYQI